MIEIWKAVTGYEDVYEVSNLGRVRRVGAATGAHLGRILKNTNRDGYAVVNLSTHSRTRTLLVHRLVAEAFIGVSTDSQVRHLDDNPQNNAVSNLAWGGPSANALDSVRNGTHFNAKKIACKRGHRFSEENTIRRKGGRECRICENTRQKNRASRDS